MIAGWIKQVIRRQVRRVHDLSTCRGRLYSSVKLSPTEQYTASRSPHYVSLKFIAVDLKSICLLLAFSWRALFPSGCLWHVSALADCLSLFSLFRFGAGAGIACVLLVRYVYCMEMAVTSNRTAAGFVCNLFMSVGTNLLALLAYLIRDWRHLLLAASLPSAPLLLFWW